jgi:hypothetical protein
VSVVGVHLYSVGCWCQHARKIAFQIFVIYFAISTVASIVSYFADCSECELFLKIRTPRDSSRKPHKLFHFIVSVAFVYFQHYRIYVLIEARSDYFTMCMLPRVLYLNIYCDETSNLFEKYLISERHSVIYPHNVKRLQLLRSRRLVAVCQLTTSQSHFEDIQFSTSKNQSPWRQQYGFRR